MEDKSTSLVEETGDIYPHIASHSQYWSLISKAEEIKLPEMF